MSEKEFDAGIYFIGHISTPWTTRDMCPRNPMETDKICQVILKEEFADGLKSIEGCSHILLFYWLDQADRNRLQHQPPIDDKIHGVFALRSPSRPNPIGISAADLVKVEGNVLTVRHIDCLDGTPLIDIKPYFVHADSKPDATVDWHQKRSNPLPPRG
ncbi:MAG: tRNA (N6-threonylcarbamoyladenosine(37)-N6)-methyltransferase TrmO [Rhizobiales bacterium]|nr:tRNA (N6-threonylcarbamoyladenosine(37)-N6)-methyltransferase TrmO [Hyphomicrobiales bacterium]